MGLLEDVLSTVNGGHTESHAGLASSVLDMLNPGGGDPAAGQPAAAAPAGFDLQSIVAKMSAGGLGDVVQSWIGKGANLPISADQIKSVLGSEVVQSLAAKAGIHVDHLPGVLAQVLPGIIDKLTPHGALPGAPPPTS